MNANEVYHFAGFTLDQRHDREPGGTFVVQDELTQRIVATLISRIGDEPANR